MNLVGCLREAGTFVSIDAVFQHHLRFGVECKRRVRRFSKLQILIKKRGHKVSGTFACRLVCLDLISPHDLSLVLATQPYSHDGKVCVDWKNLLARSEDLGVRIDRRFLSKYSILSVPSAELDSGHEISAMVDFLLGQCGFEGVNRDEVLSELFKDMSCWATRNLSGPLWAHVTGLRHIWALDRVSLARRTSVGVATPSANEGNSSELSIAEFLDAAQNCDGEQPSGSDRQVLDAALHVISFSESEDASQTLARWMMDLLQFKDQIQRADWVTAIVVSWMLDLVESGTLRKADAKPETRARYMAQLAARLWTALSNHKGPMLSISDVFLYAAYGSLMADPTCTDLLGLRAAIGSFQAYGEEVWGLPSVVFNASDFVPPAVPRVQVVHPHEVTQALNWLDNSPATDPRLVEICSTMLVLLHAAPFRLEELHGIRIENVIESGNQTSLEIEVCRSALNSLKNANAVRRLKIEEPLAIARLLKWMGKRRGEGSGDSDQVFGRKRGAGLYRRATVHATLRRILKAVTGDDSMTVHALRHAYATRKFGELATQAEQHDFNVYTHLAYSMGHASCDMTIRFYVHEFELALRREVDVCVGRKVGFSGIEAELITGMKANTLVQSARRRNIDFDEYIDDTLTQQVDASIFAQGVDTNAWLVPACPDMRLGKRQEISLYKVWDLLKSWEKDPDLHDQELEHLHEVDQNVVAAIKSQLIANAKVVAARRAAARGELARPVLHVSEAYTLLGIKSRWLMQAKYQALRRSMLSSTMCAELVELAHAYPILMGRPGYIRVDHPQTLFPMLRFLKTSGITPLQLLVRLEADPKVADQENKLATEIEEVFLAIWGTAPPFDAVDFPHPSRPKAYLLWPSSESDRSSRGVDVAGLECVLHCVSSLHAAVSTKELDHAR